MIVNKEVFNEETLIEFICTRSDLVPIEFIIFS